MTSAAGGPQRAVKGAIVTGGSGGIGLEMARVLCQAGYAVTISARRRDKLDEAAAGLSAAGGTVRAVAGDISDPGTVAAIVAAHREFSGRVDALVNNAGMGIGSRLEEITDRAIDLQVDVNLGSVIRLYREALPLLRIAAADHRNALVVNSASLGGLRPDRFTSVYSAVKAGVIAFTAAMNRELGPEGIKSTALCPAFVDTELTRWVGEEIPREEMLSVRDVGDAFRWLLGTSPNCVVPELPLTRPGDRL